MTAFDGVMMLLMAWLTAAATGVLALKVAENTGKLVDGASVLAGKAVRAGSALAREAHCELR